MKYSKAILVVAACLAMTSAVAQPLTVVHTSDTHSCIEPLSKNDINHRQADKGGYIRRATLLNKMRAQDSTLLLLDCGDYSQGSIYYNLYKGSTEVELSSSNHLKHTDK